MCVAAHPDDEDGTSLIVMRRKYGAHTVSLFSTFGEGGQNAIGPELYEELGAIRARETMAASEIQGSEPYFLGLKDFGFSKSADETFQKWGHEEALRRMVLQIRKLRPDVIITNHSITSNDHGHHQATARLVVEAFDAAADPKRFPEQLKDGVSTWQVQRLFVRQRVSQTPSANTSIVTIDPNERDPFRGTMFAEQALAALQKHATQGPWPKTFAEFTARFRAFAGQGGATGQMPLIRYRLERKANDAAALPKESHNFIDGLRLSDNVAKHLETPRINGRSLTEYIDDRHRVFDALASSARRFNTPIDASSESKRGFVLQRFEESLKLASGISSRLVSQGDVVIPGQQAKFDLVISNRGDTPAHIGLIATGLGNRDRNISLAAHTVADRNVAPGSEVALPLTYLVPTNASMTLPHAQHLYDSTYSGLPFGASALLDVGGTGIKVFSHKFMDVAPAVEIADTRPNPLVIRDDYEQTHRAEPALTVQLINHRKTTFRGQLATNFNGGGEKVRVNLAPQGRESVTITARRLLSNYHPQPAKNWITLSLLNSPSATATEKIPLVFIRARLATSLRVGYVRGFDYSLPNALDALGVESKELNVEQVKTADLRQYTSIIVDNRVYESQPELISVNQKLLDYARDGGNLIVFYHKSDEWNPDARRNRPQLAPYKLTLGNERITDENAPITFLEPNHPLLNVPNKLGPEDFVGWIQERGLYYPRDWDPQFHALLQSNDPGEGPLKGGLLVADYGRGHYIYTSMVWYRQLRAGVPGAYRMLANMISYGRN